MIIKIKKGFPTASIIGKSFFPQCNPHNKSSVTFLQNDFGIYLLFTYSFSKQLQLSLRKGKSQLSS